MVGIVTPALSIDFNSITSENISAICITIVNHQGESIQALVSIY